MAATSTDVANLNLRATGSLRKGPGMWLHARGKRAALYCGLLVALVLGVSALVYQTGGTHLAWVHLMYLPIILGAAWFGWYGGIGVALLAGLAIGPFMPQSVPDNLPQTTANWMFRTGFFLMVGAFSGLISNLLNAQINRLKQANQALMQAHENLKNAQMKLIQTAKLESVGRLAAGVAHEVKNPLAVIQLGVDYLNTTKTADASPDLVDTINEMADAVQRADAVIKGLLNFSRSEALELAPADVNSVIDETLVLVRHELAKHSVTLEKRLAAGLPEVELDRNKVKQVLINMFMNAIQAMGGPGTLIVESLVSPQGATIEIKDTGSGIPEDKLDRLFEPFFTTKPVGSGTGLGLSVSRNIIEMHKGTLRLANRKDSRGAQVSIEFPALTRS